MYASAQIFVSRLAGVEQKLQAAEAALQGRELDARTRDIIGHIAAIRATVAVTQHDVDTIVYQSRRAIGIPEPQQPAGAHGHDVDLGVCLPSAGRSRRRRDSAYTEAIAISQSIGHFIIQIMATMGLAHVQD